MEREIKKEQSSVKSEVPGDNQNLEAETTITYPLAYRLSMQYIRKLRRERERPSYNLGR